MKRATIDLWVGILPRQAAPPLFLALKTANLTVGSGSNGTYSLYAEFDNIGG